MNELKIIGGWRDEYLVTKRPYSFMHYLLRQQAQLTREETIKECIEHLRDNADYDDRLPSFALKELLNQDKPECQGCKPQTNIAGIPGAIGSEQTYFSFTKHTCKKGKDAPITVHIPASPVGIKILETKDNQVIRYQ